MSTRTLAIALLVIIALTSALTGMTINRYVDSVLAVRAFDVAFVDLYEVEESDRYVVHLMLTNKGDLLAGVRSVRVNLRWEGRLIASGNVQPENMVVPERGQKPIAVTVISNLDPGDLPTSMELTEDADWSIEVDASITHPVRSQPITLRRTSGLKR